jgi:hypothetical protein
MLRLQSALLFLQLIVLIIRTDQFCSNLQDDLIRRVFFCAHGPPLIECEPQRILGEVAVPVVVVTHVAHVYSEYVEKGKVEKGNTLEGASTFLSRARAGRGGISAATMMPTKSP